MRSNGLTLTTQEPGKASVAANHASRGAYILGSLYDLIACEAGEPEQAGLLTEAVDKVVAWMRLEGQEVGSPDDLAMTAREYGQAYPMAKAWAQELKAEPLDSGQLDAWLAGKRPRRILVIPFGGPLPGGKAGLDLDGEYFDADTDLVGPYPTLARTRDRLVDWHHDQDPTGVMRGAILGKAVLDKDPEPEGLWADFWANAGEKRRELVARLERQGVPLFGSSQPAARGVRKASDGHIEVWPLVRHTITTSPQNTHAVVPPLKALIAAGWPSDSAGKAALEAALLAPDELELGSLRQPGAVADSGSDAAAAVLEEGTRLLARLRQRLGTR